MTDRLEGSAWKAVLLLFFSSLFLLATMPPFDPDFWWHLASGRWMWDNQAIMTDDPFNFVRLPDDPPGRKLFILRQYWLGQILMYLSHLLAGFHGMVVFRALTVIAMFLFLYLLARRSGADRFISLFFVWVSVSVIVGEFAYIGDRPQLFTTLFSIVMIFFLETFKSSGSSNRGWWGEYRYLILLPLLMIIWANLHGGYILGDLILGIYFAAALVRRQWKLSAACILAIAVSGLNPCGYQALAFLNLTSAGYYREIVEGDSLFGHASLKGIARILPFLTCSAVAAACSVAADIVINRTRVNLERLILLAASAFMAYSSIRYIFFFSFISAWLSADSISRTAGKIAGAGIGTLSRKITTIIAIAVVSMLCADMGSKGWGWSIFRGGRMYENSYSGAMEYVKRNRLQGNMLNDYEAGGFLIWWLHPECRVFADGRALSVKNFDLFRKVVDEPMSPSASGMPLYSEIIDRYQIGLAVISGCDRVSGVTIPLSYILLNDPTWVLLYADADAMVLGRMTPELYPFVSRNRIPVREGYRSILTMALRAKETSGFHAARGLPLSLGIGYGGAGDYASGLFWINEYLKKDPSHQLALKLKGDYERVLAK